MVIILCLLFLTGCSFFSNTVSIDVRIPCGLFPWEEYGCVKSYILEYPDPVSYDKKITETVDSRTSSLRIRIPKGYSVPVLVIPDSGGKPAGAVYPYDLTGEMTLEISAANGFIAEVLMNLLPEKSRVEGVNIRRVIETIDEKYSQNPWSLDSGVLTRSIVMGSLSSYSIKTMDKREIVIKGCTGRWLSGNPFLKDLVVPDIYGSLNLSVYPGMNGYLDTESGRRLFIDADESVFSYVIIP